MPAGERHLVLDQVVSFALARHLPAGCSVEAFAGTFDSVMIAPGMRLAEAAHAARCGLRTGRMLLGVLTAVPCSEMHELRLLHIMCTLCRALEAATDKLRKQLINSDGMPLKVVMVQLLSTVSRRTTPLLPQPSRLVGGGSNESSGGSLYSRTMQAVEVLATLQGSGDLCNRADSSHGPPLRCC